MSRALRPACCSSRSLALFVEGITLTLVFRGQWSGILVYCGVAAGWTLRWRFLVPVLFALGAFMVVSGALIGYDWADLGFLSFLTVALGFTMLAFRRLIATVIELRTARAEVARLAISDERLRISRDVHDILGHSLSVIALKAQVARRLMQTDPERPPQTQSSDVESVARESLAEVRGMVTGYRQRSLADELQGARDVLDAAGIAFAVTRDTHGSPGAGGQPARVDRPRRRHQRAAPQPRASLRDLAVLERLRASRSRSSMTAWAVSQMPVAPGCTGCASGSAQPAGASMPGPGEGGGFRLQAYVPQAAA